jgi:hypothetical protein
MRCLSIWAALFAFGCASTELDVNAQNPAHPDAPAAPRSSAPNALAGGFEPFAAYDEASGSPGHEEHGVKEAPAGHEGHGSHTQAAPADAGAGEAAPPAGSAAVYTCPMHPQIRKPKPGSCPICGMDLVPARKEGSQ